MNFKEYKIWQKVYLEKNPNIFRADCMNPFISMNYLLDEVEFKSKGISQTKLYTKWKEINNIEIPLEKSALTRGVRHSLSKLFHLFKDRTLYMPQDVYPRYFELAKENHVETFVSYPQTDWESLEKVEESVVLLTVPFTPMGRELTQEDIVELEGLSKRKNIIIIDAVYDYNLSKNFQKIKSLLENNFIFYLHSLSKTYLSPEVLGVVYCPNSEYQFYFQEAHSNYEFKDEVSYNRAYDIMTQVPNLSTLQQKEFDRGFEYLTKNTGLEDVNENGIAYFSVIEEPFEELLKYNVLGVPASVFGSKRKDLTILTGLFYLHEK